jgi:hypothetical protein
LWYKSKLQRVQQALSIRVGTLKETQAELKSSVATALSKAAEELAVKLKALDGQHRDTAHRSQAERVAAVDAVREEAAAAAVRTAAEHEAMVARLMAEHEVTIERLVTDQVCILMLWALAGVLASSSRPSRFLRNRVSIPPWTHIRLFELLTFPG